MAVAGACVGRWAGQARMPPVDRQHEGFRFLRRARGKFRGVFPARARRFRKETRLTVALKNPTNNPDEHADNGDN